MVIYRYRQRFLRKFLTDNVRIKNSTNILWLRNVLEIKLLLVAELLLNNFRTQLNTLIAYIDARTGYEFTYLILRFAAE
ncbi:hypothetical protein D3C78_1293910 [compost metagenome]